MSKLAELREKYPTASRDPDPDCKRCKGAGERFIERQSEFFKPGWVPCICIFVDHDAAQEVGQMLAELARDELRKLRGQSEVRGGGR
jgi:hypothetical protein